MNNNNMWVVTCYRKLCRVAESVKKNALELVLRLGDAIIRIQYADGDQGIDY
jgi:hypothetical protein